MYRVASLQITQIKISRQTKMSKSLFWTEESFVSINLSMERREKKKIDKKYSIIIVVYILI